MMTNMARRCRCSFSSLFVAQLNHSQNIYVVTTSKFCSEPGMDGVCYSTPCGKALDSKNSVFRLIHIYSCSRFSISSSAAVVSTSIEDCHVKRNRADERPRIFNDLSESMLIQLNSDQVQLRKKSQLQPRVRANVMKYSTQPLHLPVVTR